MTAWRNVVRRLSFFVPLALGGAGLYLKQRAIDEMHDPTCCRDAVPFDELGRPAMISRWTAAAYRIDEWLFIGCVMLSFAILAYRRWRR